MKNILFLCTGNSCRSQMAEGWARSIWKEKYNFFSAGIEKHGINQVATKVMKEVGIDISGQSSNCLEEFRDTRLDYIFTVCSHAKESCPYIPRVTTYHIPFDDPPTLTKDLSNTKEILAVYRRVRDEIKLFISEIDRYI